jgi:hypothetical protein
MEMRDFPAMELITGKYRKIYYQPGFCEGYDLADVPKKSTILGESIYRHRECC